MEYDFPARLRAALSNGLTAAGYPASPGEIRLAPKRADAAWPGLIRSGTDAAAVCRALDAAKETLFSLEGVTCVERVEAENGWILFFVAPAVLDAALTRLPGLPPETPDEGEERLFLRMLARFPVAPLPDDPALRRTVFSLYAALESGSKPAAAEALRALRGILSAVPPMERPQFAGQLGGPARLALAISQ